MKPSSIAFAFYLAATSSAADNAAPDARKTSKLRADAPHRRAQEAGSMPLDEAEATEAQPIWGWGHEPVPCPENHCPEPPAPVICPTPTPSPERSCGIPLETMCYGRSYYMIKTNEDLGRTDPEDQQIPWLDFYEATPDKCVMAPIHSEDEWDELYAEASALNVNTGFDGLNLWVGITKSALDVGAAGSGSKDDWYNLDGSDASVSLTDQWKSGEPNNSPPYQTRAHMYFIDDRTGGGGAKAGLLRDANPANNGLPTAATSSDRTPSIRAAIYKCCDDSVVTFASCGQ